MDFGLIGAALLHEIERKVREHGRGFAIQFERTAEMPFAGGQVVELGKDRTEQIVRARIARVHAQCDARQRLGVGSPAGGKQQLYELGVGPVGARILRESLLQDAGGAIDVATPAQLGVSCRVGIGRRIHVEMVQRRRDR